MNNFLDWCKEHAFDFYDQQRDHIVHVNDTLSLVPTDLQEYMEAKKRPVHHAGITLATGNMHKWSLLPGAIATIGPHMPTVELTEKSAWMVSVGKNVIMEGVQSELPPKGTLVCLKHNEFRVGIGKVLNEEGTAEMPAVDVTVNTGSFLRR